MTGTIVGDVVGAPYKYLDTQDEYFEIGATVAGLYSGRAMSQDARLTDNSLMSLAVMRWAARGGMTAEDLKREMRDMFARYPDTDTSRKMKDFLSGNDVAVDDSFNHLVRAAVAGSCAQDLETALAYSDVAVGVTTASDDDLKAGRAVCQAVWMASHCDEKFEIVTELKRQYGIDIPGGDEVRGSLVKSFEQTFSVNSMLEGVDKISDAALYSKIRSAANRALVKHEGSFKMSLPYRAKTDSMTMVKAALSAFVEARGFEHGIRRSVTLGGDSSVIASLTGALMEATEGAVASKFDLYAGSFLDSYQKGVIDSFEKRVVGKEEGLIPVRPNDSFKVLKVGSDIVATTAYKDSHIEALRAKFGSDVKVLSSDEFRKMEADMRDQCRYRGDINDAHFAGTKVQVRTLYCPAGQIESVSSTRSSAVKTSAKVGEKARKDLTDLKVAAKDVIAKMNAYARNTSGRDLVTVSAYRVEVYDDKVIGYKGQAFADEIGIDPSRGTLYRKESNDVQVGEYSESDKMLRRMFDGCERYDALTGRVTVNVTDAIASMRLLCLDEGETENLAEEKDRDTGLSVDSTPYYGEQSPKEYRTNFQLLDDDLARTRDEEVIMACGIGESESVSHSRGR